MAYVLVLLKAAENVDDDARHAAAHEAFITSLIKRNLVLLGGGFAEPVDDAFAAYVLHCGSVEEALRVASDDPFVVHDVVRPVCIEWRLVGINPDAIVESAVIRPQDV